MNTSEQTEIRGGARPHTPVASQPIQTHRAQATVTPQSPAGSPFLSVASRGLIGLLLTGLLAALPWPLPAHASDRWVDGTPLVGNDLDVIGLPNSCLVKKK